MLGRILGGGRLEERLHEGGGFLELPHVRKRVALHCVGTRDHLATNPVVLKIVPDPLAGTQLRRLGWQEEEGELRGHRGHELRDQLGLVGRVAIDDDEKYAGDILGGRFRNSMKAFNPTRPCVTMNRSSPRGSPPR